MNRCSGCPLSWNKTETCVRTMQDTNRPHWYHLWLPVFYYISGFKYMLFRKHWGCWPRLPLCLPSLHLFFLCDLLLYILLGTLHHVQPTGSVTESCCSTFVRVTKGLHCYCELTSPRWPPGRSCQANQGDSWAPEVRHAHGECSCSKINESTDEIHSS